MKTFFKVEVGLSGTGLLTTSFDLPAEDEFSVRSVIGVFIEGMFNTEEKDESSERFIKLRGQDGVVQWASKKISKIRPDISTIELPVPFKNE